MALYMRTHYFNKAWSRADLIAEDLLNAAAHTDFDTIIGTGMSGSLIVPRIGEMLGIHWAIVRKPHVDSHSNNRIEGDIGELWIFVDDLIDSGRTLDRVERTVRSVCTERYHYTKYVGAYCYQQGVQFREPMGCGCPIQQLCPH